MRKLPPSRTWYALFGIGTFVVFMLGAAAWQILLQADPTDCSLNGVICLFIPDHSDWYIHLFSYVLMAPLMLALFLFVNTWRKPRSRLNALTNNLASLSATDERLETLAERWDLTGKVHLLDSDDYICFCACFFSPRIYVSRAVVQALTAEELEALLLHEKYHLEHHDPLRILLGELIVSGFFFIPVLGDLFNRYLVRKEIAADQNAIRNQGNRHGIASTLQKLLQKDTGDGTTSFAVSGTEALRNRIDYMLGRVTAEPIPLWHIVISAGIPVIAIGSTLFR
jgi:beta-lactamase regulating signal transducer with metallopeptidase domain